MRGSGKSLFMVTWGIFLTSLGLTMIGIGNTDRLWGVIVGVTGTVGLFGWTWLRGFMTGAMRTLSLVDLGMRMRAKEAETQKMWGNYPREEA